VQKRTSLGKEIYASELADMLDLPRHVSNASRTKQAKRWMHRLGVAVRHKGTRRWFTTLARLQRVATAEHVWQEAVARGYE